LDPDLRAAVTAHDTHSHRRRAIRPLYRSALQRRRRGWCRIWTRGRTDGMTGACPGWPWPRQLRWPVNRGQSRRVQEGAVRSGRGSESGARWTSRISPGRRPTVPEDPRADQRPLAGGAWVPASLVGRRHPVQTRRADVKTDPRRIRASAAPDRPT
jgi:hypothetical protein